MSGSCSCRSSTFRGFRDASVGAIVTVENPGPEHLCWPELDIDFTVEPIEHPEKYPLVARSAWSRVASDDSE